MASLAISSIRSALDNLEIFDDISQDKSLKYLLKILEIFVLCARKLGNDAQLRFDDKVSILESLLQGIHDAVSRVAQEIPHNGFGRHLFDNFQSYIEDIDKEIDHWYNTLSNSLPQPTFDEVLENSGSISEVLRYFVGRYGTMFSVEALEAMVEKITFLRNFILFANLRSVEPEQLENLLLHIQAVTVNAACISYKIMLHAEEANDSVQQFKSIDPGVYVTYTRAMISSKSSTQLHYPTPDSSHDPLVTMKDFIDSVRSKLWERVRMDTRIAIYASFQLQLLYEGLRLLANMLKEQQNIFDEKIRELTRVVICDAAVIVFLLYRKMARR